MRKEPFFTMITKTRVGLIGRPRVFSWLTDLALKS